MYHYGLVRAPIPIPKAMKLPAAKSAVDKAWDGLENLPEWSESTFRGKAEVTHEDEN